MDDQALEPGPSPEQLERITDRVMAVVDGPAARVGASRRVVLLRAALILAVVGGLVGVRLANDPQGSVVVGPALAVAPPTVLALAERARDQAGPTLGDADALVAHLLVARIDESAAPSSWNEETWITAQGTGRRIVTPTGAEASRGVEDERFDEPGSVTMAGLAPAQVLGLHGAGSAGLDQLRRALDPDGTAAGLSAGVVELLAWQGVPADVRALLFEVLDRIGFTSTELSTSPEGASEVTLSGPGPDGSTLTVRIDLGTLRPLSLEYSTPQEPRPVHHRVMFRISDLAPIPS